MNADARALATALDKALRPPKESDFAELEKRVIPSAAIEKKFAKEVKELRQKRSEFVNARKIVYAYTEDKISSELLRRRDAQSALVRAGNHEELEGESVENVKAEFHANRETAKHTAGKLHFEAFEISKPINAFAAELAKDVLAEEESAERTRFESFGLAHVPSELVHALREIVKRAESRAKWQLTPGCSGLSDPQNLVPYLDISN